MAVNEFLQELADALRVRLGGPDEFAAQLAQDYEDADPGSPARIRLGAMLLELFREAGAPENQDDLEKLKAEYEKIEAESEDGASAAAD